MCPKVKTQPCANQCRISNGRDHLSSIKHVTNDKPCHDYNARTLPLDIISPFTFLSNLWIFFSLSHVCRNTHISPPTRTNACCTLRPPLHVPCSRAWHHTGPISASSTLSRPAPCIATHRGTPMLISICQADPPSVGVPVTDF